MQAENTIQCLIRFAWAPHYLSNALLMIQQGDFATSNALITANIWASAHCARG
jgi:hypothetical protein